MKIAFTPLLAACLGMLMLASCSDIMVVKRRYNRGYFISPSYFAKKKLFQEKRLLKREQLALKRGASPRHELVFQARHDSLPALIPIRDYNLLTGLAPSEAVLSRVDTSFFKGNGAENLRRQEGFTSSYHGRYESVKPEPSLNSDDKVQLVSSGRSYGDHSKKAGNIIWMAMLSSLLVGHWAIWRFRTVRGKRAGKWAAANPRKARGIIGLSSLGLAALGSQTGIWLSDWGYQFGKESLYACWAVSLAGLLLPVFSSAFDKGKGRRLSWILLLSSGTASMLPIGQMAVRNTQESQFFTPMMKTVSIWNKDLYEKPQEAFNPLVFDQKLDMAFGQTSEEPKPGKGMTLGKALALIFMATIVFLTLEYLILMLACTIACNGSETFAAVVGFGGSIVLIFGLVMSIRAVTIRRRQAKSETISE